MMIRFYRSVIAIYIGLFLVSFVIPVKSANTASQYPKLANYYLAWNLDDATTQQLAKWDLVILDMEVQEKSRSQLQKLRQLNPNIVILAYITSQEIKDDSLSGYSTLRHKLYSGLYDSWFLKNISGQKYSFWPGTYLLNISDKSPKIFGQRFNDYLANFVNTEILSTGLWDGVFYDNAWKDVQWFTGNNVDLDLDGQAESNVDLSWKNGMRYLLQTTRSLSGNKYYLMGNGLHSDFGSDVNGMMLENFQNNHLDWQGNMQLYFDNEKGSLTPQIIVINNNTNNVGLNTDYQKMRFGLSSALLGNGYYSFDSGDKTHTETWWYDEYNINLGNPISKAVSQNGYTTFNSDVWQRNYENGLALVNSTNNYKTVNLGTEYEKIKGTQDINVNDGSIVSTVTIQPEDGLIMFKSLQGTGKSQTIDNIVFSNGDFMRFYDMQGNRVRNGFFVFDETYAGGTKIFEGDLDGQIDTKEKVVVTDNFRFYIYDNSGGELLYRYPFDYGNRFNLAIGKAFGNLDKEIMISNSGNGRIMVFNYYGLTLNRGFYPLGENNKTGIASMVIGNVNGGDRSENIIAFKNGGSNEIMIYNFRFSQLLKRFVVGYGAKDILVSSGDLTGNGIDEIVVGLVVDGKTIIKTFNFNGNKLTEFSVPASFGGKLSGLATLDVNFDGKKDIVFMSR